MNFAIWLSIGLLWVGTAAVARPTGRGRSAWASAYCWFALFWLVQFTLLQFGLLDYFVEMQGETAIFIVSCHAAFAVGAMMVMILTPVPAPVVAVKRSGAPNDQRKLTGIMLWVGLACQMLLALDRLAINGMSFSDALDVSNISEVRAANFAAATSNLGPLYLVAAIGASCSYVGLAMFFYNRGLASRWTVGLKAWALPIMAFGMIGVYQLLLLGGRGGLLFVLIIAAVAFFLGRSLVPAARISSARRAAERRLTIIAILVLALPLSIASAWFQVQRDGAGSDPFSLLYIVHAAKPSDLVLDAAVNDRFLAFYLLQFSYLTSSSQLLNFYVPLGSYFPGPYYGSYNFAQPFLVLGKIFGGSQSFADIRYELFAPLISQGHHGNVWTTLLRDLYADFGYAGTILFLFLFGALVQAASDSMRRRPTAAKASFVTMLRLICIWSAFHSLFFIEAIFWATVLSGGLALASRAGAPTRRLVHGRYPSPEIGLSMPWGDPAGIEPSQWSGAVVAVPRSQGPDLGAIEPRLVSQDS
ncbi:hypothetical protein C3941_24035 [Kaistia algarum]|uniref:O-antigen polymerase n=1 Tax=Kaistia algarum TaxID=2083279 RepID=UPI000CE87900|nr:O-antigen polymerase [Kaistia algarum]MCX5514248.1 O-antigen ligase [Kaistia algarum]PPE77365.1 hypothetical protein C3941_24035 [Kaistia algarum]